MTSVHGFHKQTSVYIRTCVVLNLELTQMNNLLYCRHSNSLFLFNEHKRRDGKKICDRQVKLKMQIF